MKRISIDQICPNIGVDVLKELSVHLDLPSYGIVGGQSVASVVLRMLGIRNVGSPINDIDVFLPITPSFDIANVKFEQNESKILSTITSSQLELLPDDGYRDPTLSLNKNYKIISSERVGIRNNIYIHMLGGYTNMYRVSDRRGAQLVLRAVVNDFDINAVQCGVDLISKKFYATGAFFSFLRSLTLEITNFKTPVHSIIRLAQKEEELNVRVEKELASIIIEKMIDVNEKYYQKEILSQKSGIQSELEDMGIESPFKKVLLEQPFVFGFGAKYHKKYTSIKRLLDSSFNLVSRIHDVYDTYTLSGKNNPLSELDNYINMYINGRLYDRLAMFQRFSRYDRVNLLLRNLPNIVKSSVEKRDYYFFGDDYVGFKGIEGILKKSEGYRGIDRTVLNVRPLEFCIEGERLVDHLWDTSEYNNLFQGMGSGEFLRWYTSFGRIKTEFGLDLARLVKGKGVSLRGVGLSFLTWFLPEVTEDMAKTLNSQASFNILFDIMRCDFEKYVKRYEETLLSCNTSWEIPSMELSIIEYIDKKADKEEVEFVFDTLLRFEKNSGEYSQFLMAAAIRRLQRPSAYVLEALRGSKKAFSSPFLREMVFSRLISTQTEFLEYKEILGGLGLECDDFELNGYLFKNKRYLPSLKLEILESVIADLNMGAVFDEKRIFLFEIAIQEFREDRSAVRWIVERLKNPESIVLLVEKLQGRIEDEVMVNILDSVPREDVFFYLKNEKLRKTLEKINF